MSSSSKEWQGRVDKIDPITVSAAAAVFFTTVTNSLFTRQSEVYSETLSWLLLPFLFKHLNRPDTPSKSALGNFRTQPTSSRSLWIVATGLVVSCVYKAEFGTVKYWPLLTPLVIAAQNRLQADFPVQGVSQSPPSSHLLTTGWGAALVAVFAAYVLSNGDLKGSALSAIAVSTMLLVYVALLPRTAKSPRYVPRINSIIESVGPLASKVVVLSLVALAIQFSVFGFTTSGILSTLLSSLTKSMSWYFTIQMSRHVSWSAAAAIGTFSLASTCSPAMQSSELQALSKVAVSLLTLGQIVYMLPQQARNRAYLWGFAVIPVGLYLENFFATRIAQHSAQLSFSRSHKHPAELLVEKAKTDFESMVQKQSKTYTAAHNEYRRRYGIEPPAGFEAWYDYAVAHQSPIIDDFDIIHDTVSPFWSMSGNDFMKVMTVVHNTPDAELWSCEFSSQWGKIHCTHPWRSYDRHISLLFNTLLGDSSIKIPKVKFLVNHLDEPRILAPPQSTSRGTEPKTLFVFENIAHRPSWSALTKFCTTQKSDKSAPTHSKVETHGLPFVTNITSAMDVCSNLEYEKMHGLFMSPTSLRLIEGLIPVLSTGTPSTMNDILFPSAAYIESEFLYDDTHDPDWTSKQNNLYWAGSTSGSYATNSSWQQHHRQRFVALAQNLAKHKHTYLHEHNGVVTSKQSTFLNPHLYSVTFTRIFQCTRQQCRSQRSFFPLQSWAPKDAALSSKLVFDLDGNGISGRYYKLLASKSCPLKQTLFREWHDDRLVPWLHYIPVSQGLEELPELVSYLTSNKRGQETARVVAEAGRDWYKKAFRQVDLSIYVYRLLLEIARLQDPAREAGTPSAHFPVS